MFSSTCSFPPPDRTHLHATFELGKELRSSQSFEPTSPAGKRCFLGGTETSGGLTALRNPPGVFPMGPSTEETWNRFRNPETWLMLRRKEGFQRIRSRNGARRAIQRYNPRRCWFKSLAAARNWVRENPETRPAKSPRAPAAATLYFHPDLPPHASSIFGGARRCHLPLQLPQLLASDFLNFSSDDKLTVAAGAHPPPMGFTRYFGNSNSFSRPAPGARHISESFTQMPAN